MTHPHRSVRFARQSIGTAAVVVTLLTATIGVVRPGAAAAAGPCDGPPLLGITLDGLPGNDLPIGEPGANDGAGQVVVHYHSGTDGIITPGAGGIPAVNPGAHFGAALHALAFNPDSCLDLAVGIPDLTVDGVAGAGGVQILISDGPGFTAGPLLTAGSFGIPGPPTTNEHLGSALEASTFFGGDGPESVDLYVGAPGADVGHGDGAVADGAGQVVELATEVTGTETMTDNQVTVSQQGDPEVPGTPEDDAHFGSVIAYLAGLGYVASAPDEDVGHHVDAGYVATLNGCEPFALYGNQAHEHYGASIAQFPDDEDLLIGAPGKKVHGIRHAGAVDLLAAGCNPVTEQWLSRRTSGVAGAPKQGEHFGQVLASHLGSGTVVIGVPKATVDGEKGAGAVVVVRPHGRHDHLAFGEIDQATAGVPGIPEAGDSFGAAAAVPSRHVIAIGDPDEAQGTTSKAGEVEQMHVDIAPHTLTIRASHASALMPPDLSAGLLFGAALDLRVSEF
jgi:hypothetical protein